MFHTVVLLLFQAGCTMVLEVVGSRGCGLHDFAAVSVASGRSNSTFEFSCEFWIRTEASVFDSRLGVQGLQGSLEGRVGSEWVV